MTKLCSVCGTENREEAQFCRACGNAFSAQVPLAAGDGNAQNVCSECGFQNKPGLRYCANCGMSLGIGAAGESATGGSPPPLSYPSFAPVAPYPPAPVEAAFPDLPDPDAEIALRQQEAAEGANTATLFESAPSRSRAPIVIGAVALALVVAGALAWTYMRGSDSSPPAIGATAPPVAATLPASAAAPPPVVAEPAPSAPTAIAAPASAIETPPPASADALPPAAARPLPQVGDTTPPESAEAEAKRVAAERRAKAAREKAERDARAAADQRDQSAAAAQRAEQDAARKRADDAQRARTAAAPVPASPAPAVAQARGVRELCAGRGTIAEAVCQSRSCGQPEHANEAICRQLREQDERRRNFGN